MRSFGPTLYLPAPPMLIVGRSTRRWTSFMVSCVTFNIFWRYGVVNIAALNVIPPRRSIVFATRAVELSMLFTFVSADLAVFAIDTDLSTSATVEFTRSNIKPNRTTIVIVSSVHATAQHRSEILVVRSSNTTRGCFSWSLFASPDSNISRSASVACSFATCTGSRDDRVDVFALVCVWSCDPSGMEENIPLVVAACGCPQSICIRVRPFGAVLDCIFSVYRDLAINKRLVMFVYERRALVHLAYHVLGNVIACNGIADHRPTPVCVRSAAQTQRGSSNDEYTGTGVYVHDHHRLHDASLCVAHDCKRVEVGSVSGGVTCTNARFQ